jgi:hypothetical protein
MSRSLTKSAILRAAVTRTKYLTRQYYNPKSFNPYANMHIDIPQLGINSIIAFVLFFNVLEFKIKAGSLSHITRSSQFLR